MMSKIIPSLSNNCMCDECLPIRSTPRETRLVVPTNQSTSYPIIFPIKYVLTEFYSINIHLNYLIII